MSADDALHGSVHRPRSADSRAHPDPRLVAHVRSRRSLRPGSQQRFQHASAPHSPVGSHPDLQPDSALYSGIGNSLDTQLGTSTCNSTHHSVGMSIYYSIGTSLVNSTDKPIHISVLYSIGISTGN